MLAFSWSMQSSSNLLLYITFIFPFCSHLLLYISLVSCAVIYCCAFPLCSHLLLCSSLTSAVVCCLVHFLNKCILLLLHIPVTQAVVYIFSLCSHLLLCISLVQSSTAVQFPCAVVYCLVHFLNKCIFYCCNFPCAVFYCCTFPE